MFWSSGFWSSGFWSSGFWEGDTVGKGGRYFEYQQSERPFRNGRLEELKKTEPAIAKEIEALALKAARADEPTLSAAQVQAHLKSVDLAYELAYLQIYVGLIEEIEQEQEFEAIALCMALLL